MSAITTYEVGALSKALTKDKRKHECHGPGSEPDGLMTMFAAAERQRQRPLYVPYQPVEHPQPGESRKQWADSGDNYVGEQSADVDDTDEIVEENKRNKKRWPSKPQSEDADARRSNEEKRTVFVGNLPNKINRKAIRKIFRTCGQIDTIRIRSVALADPAMPRKVGIITHDFHPKRNNLNAYIRFQTVAEAEAALQLNGTIVDKFHIRVDMADKNGQHANKRSVFLGNLPFDIEEEALYSHFEDCGEIESVRLVRDNKTSIGKGFGFVTFKTTGPVELALRLDGTDLDGRSIRISRAVQNPKKGFNATKIKLQKKVEAKASKKAMKRRKAANAERSPGKANARKSNKLRVDLKAKK